VVGSFDSMGRSACDRVGPGWISRFVPSVDSEIKTSKSRSLTAEMGTVRNISG
jgi:hypothetical protein